MSAEFDFFDQFISDDLKNSPVFKTKAVPEDDEFVTQAIREAEAAERAAQSIAAEVDAVRKHTDVYDAEIRAEMAKMAEIQRRISAIKAKKAEEEEAIFLKKRELRKATATAESKRRAVDVARQALVQRERYAQTQEEFERIAADKPWRVGVEVNGTIQRDKPHQWEAIKFLGSARRALLGDGMGLGKSLSSIGALDMFQSKRALVITQNEIASNFLRELRRWAPHRTAVSLSGLSKADREMRLFMAASFEPVVVVANYEIWRRDKKLMERMADFAFDTIIVDESHNIKSTSSETFRDVLRLVHMDNLCPFHQRPIPVGQAKCPECDYRRGTSFHMQDQDEFEKWAATRSVKNLVLMTGTPILNAPEDLWPMMHLIDPIAFPYKNEFLREYCTLDSYTGKYTFRAGGLDSLMQRLSGRYLARNAESAGVEIPPQDVVLHDIEFPETEYTQQQMIIEQLTKHAQIVLSDENKTSAIEQIALITRQRQANVWPGGIQIWEHPKNKYGIEDTEQPKELIFDASHIQESIKIDRAIQIFEDGGAKNFALFSQFKTALAEIERRLVEKGYRVARYDGDTTSALRERIKYNMDKSNGETPEWDIILCNYKTGGTGLTLTNATQLIVLDEEWNPGKRDQAYKRIARIGQDSATTVHLLRVKSTVDEWLAKLIDQKEQIIGGFDDAANNMQDEFKKQIMGGK